MTDQQTSEQKDEGKSRQESLGEYLKRERLLRNITLEDVARITKVSQQFLKALEEGNYQILPGEAFVKGFLRAYAKVIGLEPNEIILIYDEYNKAKEGRVDPTSRHTKKEVVVPKSHVSSALIVAIVIVFLLLGAAYFGWDYIRQQEHGSDEDEAKMTTAPSETSQSDISNEQQKGGTKKILTGSISKWEPFDMEAQAQSDAQWLNSGPGKSWLEREKKHLFADSLSLSIKAKTDAWVSINIDPPDGMKDNVLLSSGMLKIWFAKEKFVLSLNKPDGVKLELNGIDINPFSKKLSTQEITITKDNIP